MEGQPNNHLTSFTDHLNAQYGERGTPTHEEFEKGFKAFKLGALQQELRPKKGIAKRRPSAQRKS